MHSGPGAEFLKEIGLALAAALVGGMIARRLRLPVLLGYLAAGLIVGPHTPGMTVNEATVRQVADLGVALLMFAVGVHFSMEGLGAVRRTVLIAGGAQIGGMVLLGVPVGLLLGWGLYGGLFLGCALALSSTAVMLRILEERGELGSAHGSLMLGILILQDLSLVAMAALLPSLAELSRGGGAGALTGLGAALLRAALFVGVTLLLATRIVPALLARVARAGSPELFLLAAVCLCFAAGLAAELAGLGLPLGAFLGGLVISGSPFAHEVFARVQPLRDVFASLFFVSVGMLLDPKFLARHWLPVLLVVLVIVLGKAAITAAAVWAAGRHGRTALLTGLGLAQIGEFSFVLAGLGSSRGLIPAEVSGVILSAALLTLLLTPFVYGGADRLYLLLGRVPAVSRLLNRRPPEADAADPFVGPAATAGPVLILGGGRVGRYVADALRARALPHLVVDFDLAVADRLGGPDGARVLFGDATSEAVLSQTAPGRARLAVVALPEAGITEMAVRLLKRLAPDLPVVARVHRGVDIPRMRAAGADAVIHAEFEAGVETIRQTLDRLGVPDPEVDAYLEDVRRHRYREEE